jgi:predicted nucleic acid-binding Zn ribbon protein
MRRSLPQDYTPGSWRVRREFLRVPDAFPPPPFKDAEAAGSAVGRVVKALGIPEADPAALRIAEAWAEIVGPDVARRATPGGIENGELVVRVRGSVWYAELKRTAPRLLLPKVLAFLGGDPARSPVRAVRVVPAR